MKDYVSSVSHIAEVFSPLNNALGTIKSFVELINDKPEMFGLENWSSLNKFSSTFDELLKLSIDAQNMSYALNIHAQVNHANDDYRYPSCVSQRCDDNIKRFIRRFENYSTAEVQSIESPLTTFILNNPSCCFYNLYLLDESFDDEEFFKEFYKSLEQYLLNNRYGYTREDVQFLCLAQIILNDHLQYEFDFNVEVVYGAIDSEELTIDPFIVYCFIQYFKSIR